jgi:carbon monoxide dehydrogenase subunit G
MISFRRVFVLKAPVEKVFAYISNPENETEYIPGVIEIRDISGEGVGLRCKWTYKIMGFRLNGEAEIVEYEPNLKYVIKTKGDIESTWNWTFEEDSGKTRLKLKVDYSLPVHVLDHIGEALLKVLNSHEANYAMAILKKRLENQ